MSVNFTTRTTEKAALGKVLRQGGTLDPADFRFPPHPEICRAILAVQQAGHPVGLTTVGDWLSDNGLLDATGGTIYLAELVLAGDEPG
ncbi:MAG: DnaB-like helicase N-terminal domain-containing protein [Armatimonadota bacterium]